jgi:23S rRNA maturation-related 3'-5' exoribonuclease YhaM
MLADRTGHISAKMWDNIGDIEESFGQDSVIKVKGVINKYNQRWQLTIHKLRKLEEAEVDFSDFLPKTEKNIDELWQSLSEFVASIQDHDLRALLKAFMADPKIAAGYRRCTTHTSVGCSITSARSFAPAISSCAIIHSSTAISCSPACSFTISGRSTS